LLPQDYPDVSPGEVIERARIVVATTACSGGPRFSDFDSKAVIVDEANQLLDCELAVCFDFASNV
jgi:hypothetical protein